jgi:hypothetical protein
MKPPEESEPRTTPDGRRLPEYVVVISASDWAKEHFPASRANLMDALRAGHDRPRDPEPEPDLEAEP